MRAIVRSSFERGVRKITRKEKGRGVAQQIEQAIDELKSSIETTTSQQNIFQLRNVEEAK